MDSLFKEKPGEEIPEMKIRQRKKRKASKAVFKQYNQGQTMLLPPSLEELIEDNQMVRVLNTTIDQLNIEPLIRTYKGGGTSSYDPSMMIKVILYAYLEKIYSSRRIAKAIKENIHFMWLSGGVSSQPDFRTINDFRSGRLKSVIEELFGSMVLFLSEKNYIDLEKYFVDGTKIAADANRNSYVWGKNTKRYKESVKRRVSQLFEQIEAINRSEDEQYKGKDYLESGHQSELTSQEIRQEVERLSSIINQNNSQENPLKSEVEKDSSSVEKKIKSKDNPKKKVERIIKKIAEKELPKLEKYEQQEEILAGRNSYSKTDNDAAFLRMKNKEVLPAYNVMIGTVDQFIVNYTIEQSASETDKFINHMEQFKKLMGRYPKLVSADSAYGSEENNHFLKEKGIDNYMKYPGFHNEMTEKYKKNIFHKDHIAYDKDSDSFLCPNQKLLSLKEIRKTMTKTGFEQTIRIYQSEECQGCPFSEKCKGGKSNRTIQVNRRLDKYRRQARKNLTSQKAIELRKQRNADVEPVFGDIKHNQSYRRFRLRGKQKVNIEMGLLSMSHNLKKLALLIN
jgi:transposase